MALGLMVLLYMMFRWFGDVIRESEGGKYGALGGPVVPLGHELVHLLRGDVLRRLLRRAVLAARDVGARSREPATSNTYLWPGFTGHWPSAGPGFEEKFSPMGAWGMPALNTALLLSSGVTVTHRALGAEGRQARDS